MVSMHEASENPEFVKTIEEIRNAEGEYERLISEARAQADGIVRKAKETVHEEREKTEESVVNYKNEKEDTSCVEIRMVFSN